MVLFAIVTEVSLWLLPLCFFVGGLYTWLFYRNDKSFESATISIRRLMIAFRFLVVSIIAFFLLSPFLQSTDKTIEKPIIIIAHDNSESIVLNRDSVFYRKAFQIKMDELSKRIGSEFTVKDICFDSKVFDSAKCTFKGKATDFGNLFSYISKTYANYNIGAVVIASDGIYNRGSSPTFAADSKEIKAPVYTIAMGDTVSPRDIAISNIKHNQISFEGDVVPVEVQIKASHVKNENSTFIIKENDNVVFSKNIMFNSNDKFLQIPVELMPDKAGIHHYRIEVSHVENELTFSNNTKDFVLEVLKNKQKILIVYNAPNPDIGALKRSLETNVNYSIDEKSIDEPMPNLADYNLVILSQIPSRNNASTQFIQALLHENIPSLILCGVQTDLSKFNAMYPGLVNQSRVNGFDETQMKINNTFPLFELDEDEKTFIEQCQPLTTPFATFNTNNATVFSFQKINSVETDKPLLLFLNTNESKTAILFGEGIWKWRVASYKISGGFRLFDTFIIKIANYLSLSFKKTKFVITSSRIFQENEAVVIDAELYNDSYELVNNADIGIEIFDAKEHSYPFTFSKTNKAYTLNAGVFPKGDYHYRATTKQNDKTITATGAFSVLPINIESENVVAKHNELFSLSQNHNGKMYLPNEIEKLADELLKNNDIKPISHFDKAMKELVEFPIVFILLLLLLSVEWFLRKYFGSI